jgi:hypothetical protein
MIVTLKWNVALMDEESEVYIPKTTDPGPYYIRCKYKRDFCLFHLMLLAVNRKHHNWYFDTIYFNMNHLL